MGLFSWAPKSLQMVTEAMKLRCLLLARKAMTNLDSILFFFFLWPVSFFIFFFLIVVDFVIH